MTLFSHWEQKKKKFACLNLVTSGIHVTIIKEKNIVFIKHFHMGFSSSTRTSDF